MRRRVLWPWNKPLRQDVFFLLLINFICITPTFSLTLKRLASGACLGAVHSLGVISAKEAQFSVNLNVKGGPGLWTAIWRLHLCKLCIFRFFFSAWNEAVGPFSWSLNIFFSCCCWEAIWEMSWFNFIAAAFKLTCSLHHERHSFKRPPL